MSYKQVAAIAEKNMGKSFDTKKPEAAPKASSTGTVTKGLKPPPKLPVEKDIKIKAGGAPPAPKFKVTSIDDLKKIRQSLKGEY